MNDNVQGQIDAIYDRQKEVNIGLRNVNCLSCAIEPPKNHNHGNDGRLYKGLQTKRVEEINAEEAEALNEQSKALLNMRWDHLGLSSSG